MGRIRRKRQGIQGIYYVDGLGRDTFARDVDDAERVWQNQTRSVAGFRLRSHWSQLIFALAG